MKVLKSLAVLALVFTLGACETKPKDEAVDPTAFLAAVKGKTAETTPPSGGAAVNAGAFSADGKIFTDAKTPPNNLTFQGADSDLIGKYKDPSDATWTFILNDDKKSGVAKGGPQDMNFTLK